MSSASWSQRSASPLNFRVRVSHAKGDKALWGGAGVAAAITGTNAYLLVRVDERGERLELLKQPTPASPPTRVAILDPGESFLVSIDNAVSIIARCADDTFVDCAFITKG
jgi:hypothetical protein